MDVGAWPGSKTSLESLPIPASDKVISSHTENLGEPDLEQRKIIITNFSGIAALLILLLFENLKREITQFFNFK